MSTPMKIVALICFSGIAFAQTPSSTPTPGGTSPDTHHRHHLTSAKNDVGRGASDIGKGAGKALVSAATGTWRATGDLVALHPVMAATDLGRGVVGSGKNLGVGAVKGTGKMIEGAGKAIKHLL